MERETAYNPDTGEYAQRAPGGTWEVVSTGEVEASEMGRGERILRGAGASVKGTALGVAQLVERGNQALGWDTGQDYRDTLQAARDRNAEFRAGIGAVDPAAGITGEVAPYALGGAVVKTGVRGTLALEGALGAAGNPDNPVQGALIGAAGGAAGMALSPVARGMQWGAGAARKSAGRVRDMMPGGPRRGSTDFVPESMGDFSDLGGPPGQSGIQPARAAGTGAGQADEAFTPLPGYLTPEEAAKAGLPLTRGDAAALRPRQTRAEWDNAGRLRDMEELGRSDRFIDELGPKVNATRAQQEEWLTGRVKQQLGIDAPGGLTDTVRGQARADTSAIFAKHLDNIDPAKLDLAPAAMEAQEIAASASMNAGPKVQQAADKIMDAATREDGGKMLGELRSQIGKDAERAAKAGNFEQSQALYQMQEQLDAAIEGAADAGAKAELQTARRRWRILKTIEETGTVDPAGQINPRTFGTQYRKHTPGAKSGSRSGEQFERELETLEFLNSKVVPNSGTMDRAIAAGPGKLARAVTKPVRWLME